MTAVSEATRTSLMRINPRVLRSAFAVFTLAHLAPAVWAQNTKAPATKEDIPALVQALGEASYEARTNATLRLIGVGSEARPELEKAAAGADA